MRFSHLGAIVAALLGTALLAQPLTIYTEIFAPDQFTGPDGNLTGYAVEVVQEIQKRTNHHDPIQLVPWVRGYREAQQKPNVVLFSMARSKERDALFQWVGPIKESSSMFYVKADSGVVIDNLEQAKRLKRIGVYRDDARDQYLTKVGFTNLDRSVDQEIILKKLLAGRVEAMASAPDAIADLVQSIGVAPETIQPSFTFINMQLYIAMSKTTPQTLVQSWNDALSAMKKDGAFRKIFHKYYPRAPLPGPAAVPF